MKKILISVVMLGVAGGAYAAGWSGATQSSDQFNELAVKASDLKKADVGVSVPSPDRPAAVDKNNVNTVRFVMHISGVCGGLRLAVPSWCPEPGNGVVGGVYKEIRVRQGERVEIELNNDLLWTPGQVSFILTSVDPIEACSQNPVPSDQVENCAEFPLFGVNRALAFGQAVVSFTASRVGDFKYYDGLNPSGYGRLVVEP